MIVRVIMVKAASPELAGFNLIVVVDEWKNREEISGGWWASGWLGF
jgi:hypothetical protein